MITAPPRTRTPAATHMITIIPELLSLFSVSAASDFDSSFLASSVSDLSSSFSVSKSIKAVKGELPYGFNTILGLSTDGQSIEREIDEIALTTYCENNNLTNVGNFSNFLEYTI